MSSHPDQIRSASCGLPLQRAVTADVLMRRVAGLRVWLGLVAIYLVGGDWNMTFIFPYIGNIHPN